MTWKGARTFITGNTGFKGSWLSAFLRTQGALVSGFALPPQTNPNLFELLSLSADTETTFADIRDLPALEASLARAQPEVVFHLAAQPIVRESIEDPLATYSVNVMGTAHVLDAIRRMPSVRAVVIVTSDKCYENVGWPWPYRETEAMGGEDPYSSSKGCAELVTSAYRRTYFPEGTPAVASARAGNVIGGGDWSRDRLIPDLVRALAENRAPALRYPGAIRPWQHVLDAINGYVMLAEALLRDGRRYAEGWNFGPSESSACTVADLTQRFLCAWGTEHRALVESAVAPHEAFTLRLDSTRARLSLNWRPRLELDDAITWTAEWYRAWHDGTSVAEATQRQIERFALASATRSDGD
ncbi:MAG TPA: CDP-glucose 4,6-dehydratase [Candidatus Aquilonibacter sp.]